MVEEMGGCRRRGGSGVGTSRGESLGGTGQILASEMEMFYRLIYFNIGHIF
jgi:hypothetical protein